MSAFTNISRVRVISGLVAVLGVIALVPAVASASMSSFGSGQLLFDPVLSIGQAFRNSNGVDGCLLLVQAEVKH